MVNKIYLKKILLLEFGCHYMTELTLQLHIITLHVTAVKLPLVQSGFFEAFYSVTALVWLFICRI